MSSSTSSRDGFSSGSGVTAATLGSAVGLGNIWMFPVPGGHERMPAVGLSAESDCWPRWWWACR